MSVGGHGNGNGDTSSGLHTGSGLRAAAVRAAAEAAASRPTAGGARRPRPGPPEEVMFPVTPMLDMAFQLLAFFVLTFQAPSAETHLDLDLPTTPAALPGAPRGRSQSPPPRRADADLENDLWVRVEADDLGDLKALRLGEADLPDVATLGERLKRYAQVLEGRALRVRLVADDGLRYEVAARVMAVCSASGVSSVRLTSPAAAAGGAPRGGGRAVTAGLAAAALLFALSAPPDEPGLSLDDLAPYRAALEPDPAPAPGAGPPRPPPSVTFRQLWDDPGAFRDRRVRVEGRVARRFRQEAVGTFPPLVEAWAFTPAGDPLCLVYPAPGGGGGGGGDAAAPGAVVRFEGTFLRRVRYRGGDGDRLAPLVVGPRPPVVTAPAAAGEKVGATGFGPGPAAGAPPWLDWALGLAAAGFVALALAHRHLRAPARPPARPDDAVAPEFVDPYND